MNLKLKITLGGLISIAFIGIGVLLGSYLTEQKIQAIAGKQYTTTKIAVVNLDEGTDYEGDHRNFASEMLSAQDQELVITGLNDAKSGVENGSYAAYLIMPSDFSRNVITVNTEPKKSLLKYELGANLSSISKDKTTLNILELNNSLNDDLGYMYLYSVFNELHNGQNNALKVIFNDSKDKETIMAISNLDLVQSLDIKEVERLENNVENLDVSDDFEKNKLLIDTIDIAYKGYLGQLDQGTKDLINESNAIHDSFRALGITIPDLPTIQKIDGSNNYSFDETNKKIASESKAVLDLIYCYSDALDAASIKNGSALDNILDASNSFVGVIKQKNEDIKKGNKFKALKKAIGSGKDGITIGELTNVNELFVGLKDSISDQQEINKGVKAEKSIERFIADKVLLYAPCESDLTVILSKVYEDANDDPSIQQNIDDYASVNELEDTVTDLMSYYNYTRAITPPPEPPITQLALLDVTDEDLTNAFRTDLETFISTKINVIISKVARFYPKVVEKTEFDTIEQALTKKDIPDFGKISYNLNQIQGMDGKNITNGVVTDLSPLAKDQLIFKSTLDANMNSSLMQSSEFKNKFNRYDPLTFINDREIEGYVLDYKYNNSSVESKINEKDIEYKSFMDETYRNANEHVSSLKTDVHEYQKLSDEKVVTGLEKAKSIKNGTSGDNQQLMSDFINTLPYSRLGSAENTSTYQFMINPINKETTTLASNNIKQTADFSIYIIIMLIVSSIGILGIAGYSKFSLRKAKVTS